VTRQPDQGSQIASNAGYFSSGGDFTNFFVGVVGVTALAGVCLAAFCGAMISLLTRNKSHTLAWSLAGYAIPATLFTVWEIYFFLI